MCALGTAPQTAYSKCEVVVNEAQAHIATAETPVSMSRIGAIVLAAGTASRMGTQKLLLPLGDRPLVRYVVEAACRSAAEPVVVVLGHMADEVARALPEGRSRAVINPDFGSGMASSLRAGLLALPQSVAGAVVMLGDEPLVEAHTVDAVLSAAAWAPDQIHIATYAGRRGHPAYFPARLFPELAAIGGDEGGRSVISRHADLVREVELGEARDLDADTPQAYAELASEWERRYRPAD